MTKTATSFLTIRMTVNCTSVTARRTIMHGNSSTLVRLLPTMCRFYINFLLVQTIELDPGEVNIHGLYVDLRNKIITIPDVFHQLHCLVGNPAFFT